MCTVHLKIMPWYDTEYDYLIFPLVATDQELRTCDGYISDPHSSLIINCVLVNNSFNQLAKIGYNLIAVHIGFSWQIYVKLLWCSLWLALA